jgi:hypothetical protein
MAAPIVRRIFADYIAGKGYFAIAQDLTRDGIPSPSAHDPARNRHRDTRSWSKIAVKSILQNPRYVGRQVWNRQRRDEVLVDVEDVAAGYESRMRWNDASEWVWSTEETHEAIVSPEEFDRARAQMAAGMHRPGVVKQRRTNRTYVLSGRVHCALCGLRMQGNGNHGHNHYRCKFSSERAPIPGVDHPKNVYVRESVIVPKLDEWIGSLFDPANLDETCASLAAAGGATEADHARIEAAERKLADCDSRLTKYRQALDAGADPVVVAGWMSEVQGERLRAEQEICAAQPSGRITAEQVRSLVESISDIASALADADPKLKQQVYEELGVTVTYDPDRRVAKLESCPQIAWAKVCVGGGT